MSGFVTCAKLDSELAAKQDVLTNCAGAPLVGPVPTCTEMATAIEDAATPDATSSLRGKVELATVAEATAGTDSERAVTPEGMKAAISTAIDEAIDDLPVSTLAKNAAGIYVHTNGNGVAAVIQPMDMVSTDAGQSLASGSDGKIFVNVIGLLPEDSTYSGSNNGTVDITMVPDIGDPTLITIEGNLNVAGVTPTGSTNPLQWSASGFFVDEEQMAANLVTNPTALASITGAVPTASETVQGKVELATAAEVIAGTDTTRAVTPAGVAAAVNAAVPAASTTTQGKVELATTAEAATGTDTTRAVTPAGVAAAVTALAANAVPVATETTAGKVELATTAEAAAGTDTTRAVTAAGVAAAVTALAANAVPDASATVKGKVNLTSKQVLGAGSKIVDTVFTRAVTNVTALNMDAGDVFTRTVSGATTFTVTNVPVSGLCASFILQLTNGGSAAITWPAGTKWTGGTAPTLTAAGVDILGFYTIDAGATWRGLVLSKDSK